MADQPAPGRSPSLQSRLLDRAARVSMRPLSTVVPASSLGVQLTRGVVTTSLVSLSPVPAGTRVERVRAVTDAGQVRGEWVRGPGVSREDACLLYLHGSGYVCASPRTHRGLVAQLSARTGLPAFVADYRLAPRYPFPAAADDALAAYRWLLQQGRSPSQIVVSGDSAGGHLALDLALHAARGELPEPAALVLFSPLVDISFALAAVNDRSAPDPIFSAATARRMLRMYIRDADPAHPRLARLGRDAPQLPPMFVQAGGAEMMRADAEYLAEIVNASGGRCELEIWPGQMHVFQALHRVVPEASRALDSAARFVRRLVPAAADVSDDVVEPASA